MGKKTKKIGIKKESRANIRALHPPLPKPNHHLFSPKKMGKKKRGKMNEKISPKNWPKKESQANIRAIHHPIPKPKYHLCSHNCCDRHHGFSSSSSLFQ